jgi:hypothetical protein
MTWKDIVQFFIRRSQPVTLDLATGVVDRRHEPERRARARTDDLPAREALSRQLDQYSEQLSVLEAQFQLTRRREEARGSH